MADGTGASDPRVRQFARELRLLREASGLLGEEVASRLGWSASKISRIETGRIPVSAGDLGRLVELYGLPQERADWLQTLSKQVSAKGWWDAFADAVPPGYTTLLKAEADSSAVHCYCAVVPHALLQTIEYSRAVILASTLPPPSKEVERRLDIVRRRQDALDAAAEDREPIRLAAVLDESVILRITASAAATGDYEAAAGQLGHLIALTSHPTVEIRVLGLASGPPPISSGAFTLLTPFTGASPDLVCFENKSRAFFISEEGEVQSYAQDFERLGAMALSAAESVARLEAALDLCRGGRS